MTPNTDRADDGPQQPPFDYLAAEQATIAKGQPAVLTAYCMTDGIYTYTLQYRPTGDAGASPYTISDGQIRAHFTPDQGNPGWAHFRYTTPKDALPTAFLVPFTLHADWTEGADKRLKVESTAVLVQQGDIDAGDISVNGRTTIMSAPGPVDPAAESFAPTDGFLFASFRLSTALDALTLTLVVTPPGDGPRVHTLDSGSRDETDNVNLTLPVAAGSRISADVPDGGRATLRWYPIGTGALQSDPSEGRRES